ncbi:MAG TPA: hypothetical protein VFH89_12015 [Sphingomicrobium sp.]|nr:hypothetical protein [Sphingomicrobium sp.]
MVDLNYLYHRRQVSQYHADNAICAQSRHAHQVMADSYGEQIEQRKNRAWLEIRA